MFEAARPATSSSNDQPWNFLVANRENPSEFERLLSCLAPANQAWAEDAPVLVLCLVTLRSARNDEGNHGTLRELGLACANLAMAALPRGLSVHQIIGIIPARVRELYEVPETFEAWTSMAIGYSNTADPVPAETSTSNPLRSRRR